jgi:hypothetical protein
MSRRLLAQVVHRQCMRALERRIEVICVHDVLPWQEEARAKCAPSRSSLPKGAPTLNLLGVFHLALSAMRER